MLKSGRILFVNTDSVQAEAKIQPELSDSIGGLAQAVALSSLYPQARFIFSLGPLTGFIPFCSFGCGYYFIESSWQSCYWGGLFPSALIMAGYDALVLSGESSGSFNLGISSQTVRFGADLVGDIFPQERYSSHMTYTGSQFVIDGRMVLSSKPAYALKKIGISRIFIQGDACVPVSDGEELCLIIEDLLGKTRLLATLPGQNHSCFLCPAGCEQADSVFSRHTSPLGSCLVACPLAQPIFNDNGLVFSCLRALGYSYNHDQITRVEKFVSSYL